MKLPQLSSREMVLLVLVVVLAVGWFQEAVKRARETGYWAAREGAWTIAVGELPPADGEALRARQQKSLDLFLEEAGR